MKRAIFLFKTIFLTFLFFLPQISFAQVTTSMNFNIPAEDYLDICEAEGGFQIREEGLGAVLNLTPELICNGKSPLNPYYIANNYVSVNFRDVLVVQRGRTFTSPQATLNAVYVTRDGLVILNLSYQLPEGQNEATDSSLLEQEIFLRMNQMIHSGDSLESNTVELAFNTEENPDWRENSEIIFTGKDDLGREINLYLKTSRLTDSTSPLFLSEANYRMRTDMPVVDLSNQVAIYTNGNWVRISSQDRREEIASPTLLTASPSSYIDGIIKVGIKFSVPYSGELNPVKLLFVPEVVVRTDGPVGEEGQLGDPVFCSDLGDDPCDGLREGEDGSPTDDIPADETPGEDLVDESGTPSEGEADGGPLVGMEDKIPGLIGEGVGLDEEPDLLPVSQVNGGACSLQGVGQSFTQWFWIGAFLLGTVPALRRKK